MDPTASVLFSHFTAAALVVYIIQFLKNTKYFPWLKADGQIILKKIVSVGGALTAHTGITFSWHALGAGPSGVHQFIVTLPAASVIAAFVWRWAGQWVMQEGFYQVVLNKVAVPTAIQPTVKP